VETDHGVKTAKKTLLEAVNKYFQDKSNPLYCTATILDQRFKEHYFVKEKKQWVREMTLKELTIETSGEGRDSTGSTPKSCQKAEQLLFLKKKPATFA